MGFGPDALAQLYEKFLETLDEEARNAVFVIMPLNRAVRRKDIPELLRRDPEFRKLFVERILKVKSVSR